MKSESTKEEEAQSDKVAIAIINTKMDYLKEGVDGVNKKIDVMSGQFVAQTEFKPVRNLVYGLVALILTAVITGIMALVIRR